MSEDSGNKENSYKLSDATKDKKSVLLLVRGSVRSQVEDYLSKMPGAKDRVRVAFPSQEQSLDSILQEGCDVAVVEPLAYTGVHRMRALVSKVAGHTRKGLILVRRNLPYAVPDAPIYREVCDTSVKSSELAEMVYGILSRAAKQPESKYA